MNFVMNHAPGAGSITLFGKAIWKENISDILVGALQMESTDPSSLDLPVQLPPLLYFDSNYACSYSM